MKQLTAAALALLLIAACTALQAGEDAAPLTNEDDGVRSVKLGRSKAFSYKSVTHPDKDWVVKAKVEQAGEDRWRIVPEKPLKPGEYDLWVAPLGYLYDFGVDR